MKKIRFVILNKDQRCGRCKILILKGETARKYSNLRKGVLYRHKNKEICENGITLRNLKK